MAMTTPRQRIGLRFSHGTLFGFLFLHRISFMIFTYYLFLMSSVHIYILGLHSLLTEASGLQKTVASYA